MRNSAGGASGPQKAAPASSPAPGRPALPPVPRLTGGWAGAGTGQGGRRATALVGLRNCA